MQLTNSGRASNFIRVVMAPPDSATGGWRTAVILTCWTCSKASGVAWVKVSMWMPAPGSSRIKQPMSNHLDGYKETGVLAKKGWIVFIGIERNNRVGVSQLKKRKIVRQEMIKLSSFSTDYLFSYTLESPTIRNISPLVRPMTSQVVTWTLCLRQLFVASQGTSWSFSKFFWETVFWVISWFKTRRHYTVLVCCLGQAMNKITSVGINIQSNLLNCIVLPFVINALYK